MRRSSRRRSRPQRILEPGSVIDGIFEIGPIIGTGGMGQVFEARDRRLDREVAIKACWPDTSGSYLHDEAKFLASFRHPGIVAVHYFGKTDEIAYMVMERLYGQSLAEIMEVDGRCRPVDLGDGLDVLISICDALAVLHDAGVVHRDIKPSNIMIEPGRRPVLFDFGVSTHTSARGCPDDVVGTPAYMAPEMIRSTEDRDGHRADIYALGCVAYEMFAGRRPFMAAKTMQVLEMHLEQDAPRLSKFVPGVPPALERLIAHMLRKNPDDRPQTAHVVGEWLRGIRRGLHDDAGQPKLIVLIADDDPDMRDLLASFVERAIEGVEVVQAEDGQRAFAEFQRLGPDAVLLDLDMPRMSGVELCRRIVRMSTSAASAIAAVTGSGTDRERELLRQLGVSTFIHKNDGPDAVLTQITEQLQSIRRTREVSARAK